MSFQFTTTDKTNDLSESLQKHLARVVANRISEYEEQLAHFRSLNFDKIYDYCHNVRGIAASYNLFQLDEICQHMLQAAKARDGAEISKSLLVFQSYMDGLKNKYS